MEIGNSGIHLLRFFEISASQNTKFIPGGVIQILFFNKPSRKTQQLFVKPLIVISGILLSF